MSMIKIVTPESLETEQPTIQLVKMASAGLTGYDLRTLQKRGAAEDLLKQAASLRDKVASDETLIHLIAMGSTESTGPNRNGDGFRSAVLRQYHPTFVKHAHFYRDHCFTAGAPVVMADRTRKKIETIVAGESVMTLEGPKTVVRAMCNSYDGPGVALRFSGIPTTMKVTDEHPVLVLKRSQVHCRHKYSRLGFSEHGMVCKEWRGGLDDIVPAYVPAAEISVGDYVLIPKPVHGNVRVEPAFARLVGWVAAEGNLGSRGSISFTFSSENTADIASVVTCLQQNGLHVSRTAIPATGCVRLAACSKALHTELSQFVTGVKNHKRMTPKILEWDAASLMEMLAAYIDGDGHTATRNMHCGQLRIRTSSPAMLSILGDVIRALGVPATVNYDGKAGEMMSPTNGKTYAGNGSGVVAVNAHHSPTLTASTRKCVRRGSSRNPSIMEVDGCYLAKVYKREVIHIAEDVYNLEVDGPHHYIAHDVVVHNCNTDPLKSYGRLVTSAYNEPMQRVELLVALSNNKEAAARNRGLVADKELMKLASGLPLSVSMACSVNHDLCSYCGNKAPTVASYCKGTHEGGHCKAGGLRSNIGSLIEIDNGIHHLHADNPHPNFFDISHVTRPADRIAYVTGRLKTANAHTVIKSAELAAAMCLQVPLDLRLATTTSKVASEQLRHLYMLAEQERMATDGAYAISPAHALAFTKAAQQEDTPLPPLKDFQYKVASVMRALADDRNMLPISRFIELFTATPIEKTAELATLTQLAVPGAYNRLVQSDNCEQQLHNNPYLPAKTASASDREWSHQLVPQFSVKESVLRSRVQRSALHGCLDPEFITEAAGSVKLASVAGTEAIHSLAEQYCLYKLAFLQAVPESELPLTVALTIMQNYSA